MLKPVKKAGSELGPLVVVSAEGCVLRAQDSVFKVIMRSHRVGRCGQDHRPLFGIKSY